MYHFPHYLISLGNNAFRICQILFQLHSLCVGAVGWCWCVFMAAHKWTGLPRLACRGHGFPPGLPQEPSSFIFETGSFTWDWELLIQIAWLVSKAQGVSCLFLLSPGTANTCSHFQHFTLALGNKFHFCSTRFTDTACLSRIRHLKPPACFLKEN